MNGFRNSALECLQRKIPSKYLANNLDKGPVGPIISSLAQANLFTTIWSSLETWAS